MSLVTAKDKHVRVLTDKLNDHVKHYNLEAYETQANSLHKEAGYQHRIDFNTQGWIQMTIY